VLSSREGVCRGDASPILEQLAEAELLLQVLRADLVPGHEDDDPHDADEDRQDVVVAPQGDCCSEEQHQDEDRPRIDDA